MSLSVGIVCVPTQHLNFSSSLYLRVLEDLMFKSSSTSSWILLLWNLFANEVEIFLYNWRSVKRFLMKYFFFSPSLSLFNIYIFYCMCEWFFQKSKQSHSALQVVTAFCFVLSSSYSYSLFYRHSRVFLQSSHGSK